MRLLFRVVLAALSVPAVLPAQPQQNSQHTTEAPTILEGPQTPGTAPTQPNSSEPALMSNDAVLRMHRAGLSDDLILQTIAAQPGRYDTSPDALITLKQAGLSEQVLSAMTSKARRQITNVSTEPIALSPVNEIGVYYKDGTGRWQPMESEPVHSKSSGWLKNTLSDGIIKTDMNGMVKGPESKLLLPRPIEFLIYTPEGVDPHEYDLLRFRLNGKDREFRTVTGGVFHSTGGAKNDEVEFTPVKIAPRTYTFILGRETPGAEYGILPPGTGNVTNGGKIYTFAISE
jgi:hypothetical protein